MGFTFDRLTEFVTLLLASYAVAAGGCRAIVPNQFDELPVAHEVATEESSDSPGTSKRETRLASVAERLVTRSDDGNLTDGWYRPIAAREEANPGGTYRWRHDALARLSNDEEVDLREALEASDLSLRATAAIGMARKQSGEQIDQLIDVVATESLGPGIRCAAIETYAKSAPTDQARDQLQQWFTEYETQSRLSAELLLSATDRFPSDFANQRREALASAAIEVRLAALSAMRHATELPEAETIALVGDSHLQVRVAAIELFRDRHVKAAITPLCNAATDPNLTVRLAAVEALSAYSDPSAKCTLADVLQHDGERVRAAAIAALERQSDWPAIRLAATDKSWLVRRAVAAAAKAPRDDLDRAVAHALLDDPSMQVRLAVIDSLRNWPLEEAGPLLIRVASDAPQAPAAAAKEQLSRRWPAADAILTESAGEAKASISKRLADAFAEEFGSDARSLPAPVVAAALPSSAVEEGSVERIQVEMQTVAVLSADDPQVRRRMATQLEELALERPLAAATIAKLVEVVTSDNDPLVWRSVLNAIMRNSDGNAARLAKAGLSHPDPVVRQRACGYLSEHASEDHLSALKAALHDANSQVVVAAIGAFAACASSEQLVPLEALLDQSNVDVRLAAAKALARAGQAAGFDTLELLAGDPRSGVRRSAVQAMGDLADPLFLPLLMILLEDRYDVRQAALKALPQVAGTDPVADLDQSHAEVNARCAIWQQWYRHGGR